MIQRWSLGMETQVCGYDPSIFSAISVEEPQLSSAEESTAISISSQSSVGDIFYTKEVM